MWLLYDKSKGATLNQQQVAPTHNPPLVGGEPSADLIWHEVEVPGYPAYDTDTQRVVATMDVDGDGARVVYSVEWDTTKAIDHVRNTSSDLAEKIIGGGDRAMLERVMGALVAIRGDLAAAGIGTPGFDATLAPAGELGRIAATRDALLAEIEGGGQPDIKARFDG